MPAIVRSESELAAVISCAVPAPSGIDFTRNKLVVVTRMLSPAGMGTDVLDDGTTVTFVARERRPCPNDPLPMPISYTIAFLLPADAPRAFADRSCAVDTPCR
jgi:hypothetical protein